MAQVSDERTTNADGTPDEVAAVFAANLRRLREAADLSQEELAFAAGVHRTQISLVEGGSRLPRLLTLLRLAGAVGATPNDLVEGLVWRPGQFQLGGFVVSSPPEPG